MKAIYRFIACATLLAVTAPPLFAQDTLTVNRYSGSQYQFVIDLPVGWSGYNQNRALGRGGTPFGIIVFSEGKLDAARGASDLSKVISGEKPSFFVERVPANKGMDCAGFSKGGAKGIAQAIRLDPMFGKDRKVVRELASEEVEIAGCKALRFRAETRAPDGNSSALDMHVISDGKVVYMFTLRNEKGYFDKNLPVYEASMKTIRLAAQGGPAEGVDCTAAASGWRLANDQNVGDERVMEYVPEGQKKNDWSQILTVQSFAGVELSLSDWMESQKRLLAQGCKEVEFKVLDQSDGSVLYERHCRGCGKAPDEHEVNRLLRGGTALHRVGFLSKKDDWSESDKQKWVSMLAGLQVQKPE